MTNKEALKILPDMKGAGDDWDKAIDLAVEALKVQLSKEDATSDCISRQEAIRIASGYCHFTNVAKELEKLPSAQPEPISDVCMKAVWTWLLAYQIKAAELKGRYTPYEVLSWVANDWRKEHDGSD